MDSDLFERYSDIAYKKAGIRLREGKEALVAARISKRMRSLGLESAAQYLEYLENDPTGDELVQFLDVISTNFTSFFREPVHFSVLGKFVQDRIEKGHRRLRFWSAASSSGEEPYSMAITIAEAVGERPIDWRILATDISTRVLEKAEKGEYLQSSLSPIPPPIRDRYFARSGTHKTGESLYSVCRELRQHLVYKRLNLTDPALPMKGPLDVIFCRNVMIYFDHETRETLINKIEELLAPDGLFLIGHSESLAGIHTRFRAREPSIYSLSNQRSRSRLGPNSQSLRPPHGS